MEGPDPLLPSPFEIRPWKWEFQTSNTREDGTFADKFLTMQQSFWPIHLEYFVLHQIPSNELRYKFGSVLYIM